MKLKIFFLASFLLVCLFPADTSRELDFATWLYQQGQYYAAFNAYERAYFFSEKENEKKSAALGVFRSLLKGGRPGEVFSLLPAFRKTAPEDQDFQGRLLLMSARAHFQNRNFSNAYFSANELLKKPVGASLQHETFLFLAAVKLNAVPLNQIKTSFASMGVPGVETPSQPLQSEWKDFVNRLPERPRLAFTSPFLSGALAAMLPGLGHLYNERHLDALQNFLISSVLIGLSTFFWYDDAVKPDKQGRFLLSAPATAVAGFFYLVNIYSSINVSIRRNEKLEAGFRLGIQKNLEAMALRFQIEW